MPSWGKTVAGVTAACAITTMAASQSLVSYRFDGVYSGNVEIARDLSDPACPLIPLDRIEIRDGALRAWDRGRQTVKGIITHDGFFNADYYFNNGRGHVFEGAVDRNGKLVGGVFYGRCAWVAELTRDR